MVFLRVVGVAFWLFLNTALKMIVFHLVFSAIPFCWQGWQQRLNTTLLTVNLVT